MNSCDAGINIKLPQEILGISAGFSHEVTTTKGTDTSKESTVSWGLKSEVIVPPKTKATAELLLYEYDFETTFEAVIRIAGRVAVSIFAPSQVDKKMNADSEFAYSHELVVINFDIRKIVKDQKDCDRYGFVLDKEREGLVYKVEGKCKFRFGTEQKVLVTQTPLK